MPREIEGYRDYIAELNEAYPNQRSLNIGEVATFLGVDRRTVRRLIDKRRLAAYDIGVGAYKVFRIDKADLAKYLGGKKR